jgi:hypothetical protein
MVELRSKCPICKKWDYDSNLVSATYKDRKHKWMGKGHFACIRMFNKKRSIKFSIREYDKKGKILGDVTPV